MKIPGYVRSTLYVFSAGNARWCQPLLHPQNCFCCLVRWHTGTWITLIEKLNKVFFFLGLYIESAHQYAAHTERQTCSQNLVFLLDLRKMRLAMLLIWFLFCMFPYDLFAEKDDKISFWWSNTSLNKRTKVICPSSGEESAWHLCDILMTF